MRARIVGRRYGRGRKSWVHWYASIVDHSGAILWADDCRDLAPLADEAREIVKAFDCCEQLGQFKARSWGRIVDEARI